ncbi:MAG TPA: transcriptional repressor [Pyrinomonadaceae bacterium]|nr:transcriptional repressor [Pyrinomonadaceae bacterium]
MSSGTEIQGGGRALTPQREVVLRVVRESAEHLTAAEIYAAARRIRPSLSYATVYNSLRYLKDAGLVREITFGNGASRYDRETARHDHALCTRCGALLDFDLAETAQLMRLAARRSRFKPESIHLTLMGVCPACSAAEQRKTRRKGAR